MRSRLSLFALLVAFLTGFVAPVSADVAIVVNKSSQSMTVSVDGEVVYHWRVSTGMAGRETPAGSFQPFRMEAEHFSKEWDDAPMPHSIFFTKVGHAIHGSAHRLGSPVSHGCVRISQAHATTLYSLVQKEGLFKTHVVVTGTEPAADPRIARSNRFEDLTGTKNAPAQREARRPGWPGENGYDPYGGYPGEDPDTLYGEPYPDADMRHALPPYPDDGYFPSYEPYPEDPYLDRGMN